MDPASLEEEAHVLARVAELDAIVANRDDLEADDGAVTNTTVEIRENDDGEPSKKRDLLQCCICESSKPKYRCPGCERRTCRYKREAYIATKCTWYLKRYL